MVKLMKKTTRWIGFVTGALMCGVTTLLIFGPLGDSWLNTGPANTGHEGLKCNDCHVVASGSIRQQIQGKIHFLVGLRSDDVSFGHLDVKNQTCATCHERAVDAHPVSRFAEEQFFNARKAFSAHTCVGCHEEHEGVRTTMPADGCKQCHVGLKVKNDPIDVTHESLVKKEDWTSCLGCHDFHGNFIRESQTKYKDAFPIHDIERYLKGGSSIYGNLRRYTVKEKRQ